MKLNRGKPIQLTVHYNSEPSLVDPDADANSELKEDHLFEVLPVTPADVQLPSDLKFVVAQRADYLCVCLPAS